jgi:serine/threonine-protein kinase
MDHPEPRIEAGPKDRLRVESVADGRKASTILRRVLNWRGTRVRLPEERSPLPKVQEREPENVAHGRELLPGDAVGEYVIVRRLGEGGFGTVYEASHPIIGKRAAVKVLHAQYSANESISSRFIAEARAVNQIRHKNIVDIFAFGDLSDGRHYYVMELLEGAPLDAYLEKQGRLSIEQALPILHAIAKALGAAHDAGILHRDLKPENVFLEVDTEGVVYPKILDFGMAKLLQSSSVPVHRTRSNAPVGSPRYMSPEQCRGHDVDSRTDVYAFGCIAYRMLTGRLPFDAGTALELLMAHVSTPPVPPSHHCRELGVEFDEPLLRLLEKRPEARPQSMNSAYESLRSAALIVNPNIDDSRVVLDDSFRVLVNERSAYVPTPSPSPQRSHVGRAQPLLNSRTRALVVFGLFVAMTGLIAYSLSRSRLQVPVEKPAVLPSAKLIVKPDTEATITAAASAAPPAVATVSLTLRTQPPNTEVYLGSRKLGIAPGPFSIPRNNELLNITIQAKGHYPTTVKIRPEKDDTLNIVLTAKPRRVKTSSTPGDLEDPY